jgi:hypothetical protein
MNMETESNYLPASKRHKRTADIRVDWQFHKSDLSASGRGVRLDFVAIRSVS